MRSPFKLSVSYSREDANVFFGRDQLVEDLFILVENNPLVVVYGQSGVGKTSIVQSGLYNRYTERTCLPMIIRRGRSIIEDTLSQFYNVLPSWETISNENLVYSSALLFRHSQRPVHLIFDQFEELLLLGTPEEVERFSQELKKLIDSKLPCKVILVLREEYLAQLFSIEKTIPNLLDNRLRIEPMTREQIYHVISNSCEAFNISIEAETIDLVIDNISSHSGIQLSYLQMYLDQLYQEEIRRTGGDKYSGDEFPSSLAFTKEAVNHLGSVEDLISRNLEQQVTDLQNLLHSKYTNISMATIWSVLDAFVSEEATRIPLSYTMHNGQIAMTESAPAPLRLLAPDLLTEVLQGLERRRVLRFSEESMELASDILAPIIAARRLE